MPNPLHLLHFQNRRLAQRRYKRVAVPTTAASADAIFLVMRRMRAPFIVVITTFSVCTAGMMFMPGKDAAGNPYRMTLFDAFYQMSITLTTVGYSEVPYSFSYPQRMWLTMSIYLLVVSWAYAIGAFFSLLQDTAFQDALAAQRFRRRVRRLVDPFFIVAGYGQAGRLVGAALDHDERRFVVVDHKESSVQAVAVEQLSFDVPAIEGDSSIPAVLGAAGLGHPECAGVLALTHDDEANLAVVMTVSLLRPDVPVLATCRDRSAHDRMDTFSPTAIINADDRFGEYLAQSIERPVVHQLLTWLMDNDDQDLPPIRKELPRGRWVVCADEVFGRQVASDLRRVGLDVSVMAQGAREPDLAGAAGLIVGTPSEVNNIALAEAARQSNPGLFVAVRQRTNVHKSLLTALSIDWVYISSELVAREVLARVLTPVFWSFVAYASRQTDGWATGVRDRLVGRLGEHTPEREVLEVTEERAPAIAHWLRGGHCLTIGDLLRRPDDRDVMLPLVGLALIRDGETRFVPPEDTTLQLGDQLLVIGEPDGLSRLAQTIHHPDAVEYVATGVAAPTTWLWRAVAARRKAKSA